ncbi:MAG: OmpA family protein [Gammaproteobacteria bacterium]
MKNLRHTGALVILALLMSGCATTGGDWFDDWKKCAVAGGLAGAVVGAAADDSDSAVAGAVGGAVIGGVICAMRDREAAAGDVDGDADGDGILDSRDKCPATPLGTPVDNSGCTLAERFTLEGVNFHHDSARLTDDSMATLDEAASILVRHPDLVVEVAGHTDSQGAAEYNLDLSERRALAVRDYLISRGANADMISATGYGESEPIADNGTRDGRALNRRVELRQQ